MGWEFDTDPEYQKELDWVEDFVRTEIEPLDHIVANPYEIANPTRAKVIPPLQKIVQDRKLWACHLGPDLGGPGYGQVKLALMNEILGRARCAPIVFGCQAPTAATPKSSPTTAPTGRRRSSSPPSCATRSSAVSR